MKYYSPVKSAAMLLIIVFIFFLAAPAAAFAEGSKPTVRVVYTADDSLFECDGSDVCGGYTYEYIMKIAQYAGWNVEFVSPTADGDSGLLEALDMVKDGRADFLTGILHTPSDQDNGYIYSKNSYGSVFTTLIAPIEGRVTDSSALADFNDLRIAVMQNANTRNAELKEFLKDQNITCTYVLCADEQAQYQAIESGEADLMLSVSLAEYQNTRTAASFAPRRFYFACDESNAYLMAQLDDAMQKIASAEPSFASQLFTKYFINSSNSLWFSQDEIKYLEDKDTLNVLIPYNIAPFQYSCGKQWYGIFAEFAEYLGEQTGLTVVFTPMPEDATLGSIENIGQYDIIIGTPKNYKYSLSRNLIQSSTLISSQTVLFYNKGIAPADFKNSVQAVASSYDLYSITGAKSIEYNKVSDCVEAVNRGEADFGYGSSLIVDYETSNNNYTNLIAIPVSSSFTDYCISFPDTAPTELISIVNKYIDDVQGATLDSFITTSVFVNESSIERFIRSNPRLFVVILCIFISSIAVTVMSLLYFHNMRRKNAELAAANLATNRFLSNMSHDMRTPLNGVIGFTSLALETQSADEKQDYLEKISQSGKFLLSLVNDTLDLSKISGKHSLLVPEPVKPEDIIDAVVLNTKINADRAGVKFIVDTSKSHPAKYINADKLRLQQIFLNLLSNAVKFTPSGGTVELILECVTPAEPGAANFKATVRDSGCGIRPEFLPRIYEPFAQDEAYARGNTQGTGLGLAIVSNLVTCMGGRITVKSEVNKGTEFTVYLPIEPLPNYVPPAESDPSSPNLDRLRVLVCEDHPLNMEIVSKLLEKKNVIITKASNGAEGVDIFKKSAVGYFDAVLMDIRMPVMDGLEATRSIRAADRSDSDLPIIAMTANAFASDKSESAAAGITCHLTKPIDPALLFSALARETAKRKQHEA